MLFATASWYRTTKSLSELNTYEDFPATVDTRRTLEVTRVQAQNIERL
jgi:hypothetical protein